MADQTQGNDPPQGSQDDSAKAITLEDVNRAITARFGAFEKKFDGKLGEFGKGLEGSLSEAILSKLAETQKKPADGEQQKAASIEEDPRFRSLQKQLSELKNATEAQKREVEAERAKASDMRLRQRLGEMLTENGIDGPRVKHAIGYLVDAEKRVRLDGESIVFADANGEPLDGPTGLKAWLSSDDAKLYLPPRGAAGSGEKPANAQTNAARGNAPPDPQAAAKEVLMRHFGVAG